METFYSIRSRKTLKLASIYAGVTESFEAGSRGVHTGRRFIEYEGALLVGFYDRQPIFVTTNVDLAKVLVLTQIGDDYRNHIEFGLGWQETREDLEVVSLPDMTVIPLEPYGEDLEALLKYRKDNGIAV